jgi:hypothetical protein
VEILECLLERIQAAVVGETFHGAHFRAIALYREHEAGAGARAADKDRACTADTVLAADVRAGKAEIVTQEIGEGDARLGFTLVGDAVDGYGDRSFVGHELVILANARIHFGPV